MIIYDYQSNKEIFRTDGIIQNINDYFPDKYSNYDNLFQNENIIVVKKKDKQEIYKLKDLNDLPDDKKCVVCFDLTERKHALVPCGHTQFCKSCIEKFKDCPVCRESVSSFIKIY